ncbi:hypothetical protein [Chitinophaga sp. RAB17]|uniref:hypothetical protein n=1 Tax=Chitinophaga sp. RAB17 TaxID=3233049 RepID=UPI003F8DE7D0
MNAHNDLPPHAHAYLSEISRQDVYHSDMSRDEVISTFFPPTVTSLVAGLSNITSAFYGVMLDKAGLLKGKHLIDPLSQATIYELGRLRVAAAVQANPDLDRDARGVLLVLLSAIFTSSPEFRFNVVEFKPDMVKVIFTGVDRYHRITRQLNIADEITWPSISPFIQAVCEELAPMYTTGITLVELNAESSECVYEILIYKKESEGTAISLQNLGISAPFFQLPSGRKQVFGHLVHAVLGKADDFMMDGFAVLMQYCISLEALNFGRLNQPSQNHYMMGEKFKVLRCGEVNKDMIYTAVIESIPVERQKRRSILNIISDKGEPVYMMLFDYYMPDAENFLAKFAALKASDELVAPHPVEPLPGIIRNSFNNPYQYQAVIPPFSHAQCSGHFTGYPCVPTLLIYQCLAVEAEKWLQDIMRLPLLRRPVLDGIELFPVKIIPIDCPCLVNISVSRLSKKCFKFICHIISPKDPAVLYSVVTIDLNLPAIV